MVSAGEPVRRVFLGPIDVAGYYSSLDRGFAKLGVPTLMVSRFPNSFDYAPGVAAPWLVRLSRDLAPTSGLADRNPVLRKARAALSELAWSVWALGAMWRCDVFIFGFGASLLKWNADLPLLRLFGKKVISVLAHGSDARPPYLDGSLQYLDAMERVEDAKMLAKVTRFRLRQVRMAEKYSTWVVGSPFSTAVFGTREMVNFFLIGNPVAPSTLNQSAMLTNHATDPRERHSPVVLHTPSNPAVKGTEIIEATVTRLQKQGLPVKLKQMHGVPNAEVLHALTTCDFIVDQLWSDMPMAIFATEAAAHGKVAVVGGYGFRTHRDWLPSELMAVVQTCDPDTIGQAIAKLIEDPVGTASKGRMAKIFVATHWSAENVARRYLRIVDDSAPEDWFFDPSEVRYYGGCGQSLQISHRQILGMVVNLGVDSLGLVNNPAALESLLDFYGIDLDCATSEN